MVKLDKKTWKENYFTKFKELCQKYGKALICGVDNVRSNQMQQVRIALRGKAELLMGKNTMIRKCMRDNIEEFPYFEDVLPSIVGNIGFVFTDMDPKDCREILLKYKIQSAAKAGVIAPCDVIIPAGPTSMGPEKTSFFQALNLSTKITKGTIEILSNTTVCTTGDKVGMSEAKLLNMLNISPFYYGLELQVVIDNGSVYPVAVLDISDEAIFAKFAQGVSNVAALSLGLSIPNAASVPHMIMNGFKMVLAIAVATDYTFTEAEKIKLYLENPEAFAAANPVVTEAKEEKKEEKKEEVVESESEEDMDMGLFD